VSSTDDRNCIVYASRLRLRAGHVGLEEGAHDADRPTRRLGGALGILRPALFEEDLLLFGWRGDRQPDARSTARPRPQVCRAIWHVSSVGSVERFAHVLDAHDGRLSFLGGNDGVDGAQERASPVLKTLRLAPTS
jgi:hypothetical protein